MSLKKIIIQNFKLIEDATIEPGKVNQIVGENNNGKTSVLEAIQFAMLGSNDESIIQNGHNQVSVLLEFTDGLEVDRSLTRGTGQALKVQLNEMSPQRPQSYLNGLVGVGTFNPKEVLDPKKRSDYFLNAIDLKVTKEQIEEITGDVKLPQVDFTEHGLKVIQRVSQWIYDSRTVENKRLKSAKGEVDVYEKKLGEHPVDVSFKGNDEEIARALRDFQTDLKGLKQKYSDWAEVKKGIDQHQKNIDEIISDIKEMKSKIDDKTDLLKQGQAINKRDTEKLGPEPDIGKESADLNESIKEIQDEVSLRKDHRHYNEKEKFVSDLKVRAQDIEVSSKKMTVMYKAISIDLTAKLMGEADLPVEGLSYEDGIFKLDGIDVEQLSSSKALSLALAITRKLNKKANLICIDGVEILDEQTYREFSNEMLKDEFNYFMTKVGPAFKSENDKVFEMNNGGVQ